MCLLIVELKFLSICFFEGGSSEKKYPILKRRNTNKPCLKEVINVCGGVIKQLIKTYSLPFLCYVR